MATLRWFDLKFKLDNEWGLDVSRLNR
jgi:hypothetical protein